MSITVTANGYAKVIDGKITMVTLDVLDLVWPQVVPILEESREWWSEYYEINDILECTRSGDLQMWIGIENKKIFAMGLTTIAEYPRCRILKCVFLAGSGAKNILPCVKEIEQWAAMLGATKSEIIGRDAWLRLAPPFGYVKRSVVMTKQLVANIPGGHRRH